MKTKVCILVVLVAVFSLLMAAMHDTFLLAGGSDALEINAIPAFEYQILSILALVSVLVVVIFRQTQVAYFFVFLAVLIIVLNGHTFTISGKRHFIVDRWFFIPIQTLQFDPSEGLISAYYRKNDFFISVYEEDRLKLCVLTGPDFVGLKASKVESMLKSFGLIEKLD